LAPQITAMFHSRNWKLLEERALTGFNGTSAATGSVAKAQNVWSTVYVAARDRDADGSTSTQGKGVAYDGVAVSSGFEERTFTQTDANFNVTSLVSDATDTVVERYAYLPYGQAEVLTATWSARPATAHGSPHRFQGLRLDAATGLHRARFRDYADWLGRWTQQDPAGWPDGVGRSKVFGSSSISNSDPMGLSFSPPGDPRDRYQYAGALLKFRQLGPRLIIKNDQLNHDFHGSHNVSFLSHSHLPNLLNQFNY